MQSKFSIISYFLDEESLIFRKIKSYNHFKIVGLILKPEIFILSILSSFSSRNVFTSCSKWKSKGYFCRRKNLKKIAEKFLSLLDLS